MSNLFFLSVLADVPPPYLVGGSELGTVAVLLVAGALVFAGVRLYKKRK